MTSARSGHQSVVALLGHFEVALSVRLRLDPAAGVGDGRARGREQREESVPDVDHLRRDKDRALDACLARARRDRERVGKQYFLRADMNEQRR